MITKFEAMYLAMKLLSKSGSAVTYYGNDGEEYSPFTILEAQTENILKAIKESKLTHKSFKEIEKLYKEKGLFHTPEEIQNIITNLRYSRETR